jgi:hypothetical protein
MGFGSHSGSRVSRETVHGICRDVLPWQREGNHPLIANN